MNNILPYLLLFQLFFVLSPSFGFSRKNEQDYQHIVGKQEGTASDHLQKLQCQEEGRWLPEALECQELSPWWKPGRGNGEEEGDPRGLEQGRKNLEEEMEQQLNSNWCE